jgi:low affinity Fe/Cu permease
MLFKDVCLLGVFLFSAAVAVPIGCGPVIDRSRSWQVKVRLSLKQAPSAT